MGTIPWLASQLRADGYISVSETSGWASRYRPGKFTPVGVLLHHTGATASTANPAPSLNTVINGRPDLTGPLCHVLVDYRGVCRVIAGGRANHAGTAKASGPVPAGDGNTMYVGIEIDYNGTQKPHVDQHASTVNAAAAILQRLGKSAQSCRCHKETSTSGKWDPGAGFTPTQWRSMVAAWKKHRWGSALAGEDAMIADALADPATRAVLDRLRDEILIGGADNLVSKGFITESETLA